MLNDRTFSTRAKSRTKYVALSSMGEVAPTLQVQTWLRSLGYPQQITQGHTVFNGSMIKEN